MFVSEIIDDVVEVLGRCDRAKAIQRISDAVSALQDEGDWNANIGVIDIRTFNDEDLVTLPREVETPLAVVVNGMPVFELIEFLAKWKVAKLGQYAINGHLSPTSF